MKEQRRIILQYRVQQRSGCDWMVVSLSSDYESFREKEKRKTGKSSFLVFLLVLFLVGLAVSGYKLYGIIREYWDARMVYTDLSENVASIKRVAAVEEAPVYDADTVPIEVDWDLVKRINPEIAAWLYCPATIINYPVMQTDDNDFYLHHDFRGEYSAGGALFADCGSVFGQVSSDLVIYGHNMKDGSMFGTLLDYADHDHLVDDPYMWLLTPEQDYRVEIFACREVEAGANAFRFDHRDEESYRAYLDDIVSKACWAEEDRVCTDHQLLTMSTCSYNRNYRDSRFLLYGICIPVEELEK